jgi:hypothetical protein
MVSRVLAPQIFIWTLIAWLLIGCTESPEESFGPLNPPTTDPSTPIPTPKPGTITGKVLSADGTPLIKNIEEEFGLMVLFCPHNDKDVECLHEDDKDMDISVLISSICEIGDLSKDCLLHLGQSVALIKDDGSYTLSNVTPGKYELILIIPSGITLSIHFINVEPVQAGEITVYNFQTKSNESPDSSNGAEEEYTTNTITPRPTTTPYISRDTTATPFIPQDPTATPYIPMLRNPGK